MDIPRTHEIDGPELERLAREVEAGGPIVLTRHGVPVAAMVGVAGLGRLMRERELLRRLALGELESAAGEGDELEAVLEECRMLLEAT